MGTRGMLGVGSGGGSGAQVTVPALKWAQEDRVQAPRRTVSGCCPMWGMCHACRKPAAGRGAAHLDGQFRPCWQVCRQLQVHILHLLIACMCMAHSRSFALVACWRAELRRIACGRTFHQLEFWQTRCHHLGGISVHCADEYERSKIVKVGSLKLEFVPRPHECHAHPERKHGAAQVVHVASCAWRQRQLLAQGAAGAARPSSDA